MKTKNVIEGMNILMQYYTNQDGYHLCADNDRINMYTTDTPVSEEDYYRLTDMGWQQPSDNYDPKEGWFTYV